MTLPLPTRIVMGLSDFVGQFWWVFFVAVGGICVRYADAEESPKGRYYLDLMLLKLPSFGIAPAEDRRGSFYPYSGDPDHFRCADSGRLVDHRWTSGNAVLEEA